MRISIIILLIALLPGCYNALYYYDKVAVAINLEGRPDPSAPVQISIGAKERTVIVAPGLCSSNESSKENSAAENDSTAEKANGKKKENGKNGDSVSMMSSFLISKGETANPEDRFSKTVIKAAFLSGAAAKFVSPVALGIEKPADDDPCSTKSESAIALTGATPTAASQATTEGSPGGTRRPVDSAATTVPKAEADLAAQKAASAAAEALLPKSRPSAQQGVQAPPPPPVPPRVEGKDTPGTPVGNAAAAARALVPGL